ncbi:MAG TPA: hypothetical protein VGH66_02430 [Acidimicrobiales bacterium]|jgi:hypothetical protein
MSAIWYCRSCGYEVDKGGRCHNCHQALVESDLTELAEGEVDDEVGYRLDDWTDDGRGALIEALVGDGIRHRFEGDELVVGADDEAAVDAIAARVAGVPPEDGDGAVEEGEGADDPAAIAAVVALYDAGARLRLDPTDMHADGDLAEAAGAVFAVDRPLRVDSATWAAVGRVTRRLLGALGADEALEADIATQAAILCRLLGPIADPAGPDAAPPAATGTATSTPSDGPVEPAGPDAPVAAATVEAGLADRNGSGLSEEEPGSAADEASPDDAEAAAGADGDDDGDAEDHHEVVYELDDWLPEERAQLGLLLDRDGIAHGWEGTDLIVAEVDEDRTEPLLDEVDRSASGVFAEADGTDDDEEEYQALSDLFGTADRLAGDPEDKNKRPAFVDAVAAVLEWPTPFGLSEQQWWQIKSRSQSVVEAVESGAEADVVATRAASLSDLLRGLL